MILGGVAALALHKDELNELNVFPVADGDTGSNMLKTLEGALPSNNDNEKSIGKLARSIADAILLSARGNSGVILSQIFAGICEVLENHDEVGVSELIDAYRCGVKRSYASVQNPTEGTILTVFRESTEYAAENIGDKDTVEELLRLHVEEARRSLMRTRELLPALAEAGVIDSGAAGYVYVAEGMMDALEGKEITYTASSGDVPRVNLDSFTRDSVLEHGYCTELLLRLTSQKVDPDLFDISTAISALEALGGESIVAYKKGDLVKIHVHTFRPGEVMNAMQSFGEFLGVKVENMSLEHNEAYKENKKESKSFSVVAVAEGDGITALFKEMGADVIIEGGQTRNPSIQDMMDAFTRCESKDILVLPDNGNVMLAANQAAKLYTGATVHVIETKSIAEGYAALSVINPGFKDVGALVESAQRAAKSIIGAEVTRAVRSVSIDGIDIVKDDYIAISNGKLAAVEKTAEDALTAMLAGADTDLSEIITLFVGRSIGDDERVAITERLETEYPDFEITVYNGGQDVYDYIVAVE
jgi:DAK2 domain fusion protein YloV